MDQPKPNSRLLALLLAGVSLLTLGTPVASAADDCDDQGYDMDCGFTCEAGETVAVAVTGEGNVWGNAQCQGATAECSLTVSCNDRGTNMASSPGDGDCLGNSAGGGGNLICQSGNGGANTGVIPDLVLSGATCRDLEVVAIRNGISSYVVKSFHEGHAWTVFAWNSKAGCLQSTPHDSLFAPTLHATQ